MLPNHLSGAIFATLNRHPPTTAGIHPVGRHLHEGRHPDTAAHCAPAVQSRVLTVWMTTTSKTVMPWM